MWGCLMSSKRVGYTRTTKSHELADASKRAARLPSTEKDPFRVTCVWCTRVVVGSEEEVFYDYERSSWRPGVVTEQQRPDVEGLGLDSSVQILFGASRRLGPAGRIPTLVLHMSIPSEEA